MTEQTIVCPKCKFEFKLTESLAAPLIEIVRKQYERQLTQNDSDKARELADLQEVLKQRDVKLAEAQNAQAELIKKQRELDDAKREVELTVQKRIQEGLAATRQEAKKEAEDELNLKVKEKDQTQCCSLND